MKPLDQQYSEKRKHPRYPVSSEYILILNGIEHRGSIGNISLGGVYLSTITPRVSDENLFQDCEITMNLSGTKVSIPCSISFIANETSTLGEGVGIAFATVNERSIAALTYFIDTIQQPFHLETTAL